MKTKLAMKVVMSETGNTKVLPCVTLGENEVLLDLSFFFSRSSKEMNSSSESVGSSISGGATRAHLGLAGDAGDGELFPLSLSKALLRLILGGGFECRVLHVLFITISSSSSLSLTKTGESQWESGLLAGCRDAGVLLFVVATRHNTSLEIQSGVASEHRRKIPEATSLNGTSKGWFCVDEVITRRVIIHNEVFQALVEGKRWNRCISK